jgi:carboxyl-terminal processing protease
LYVKQATIFRFLTTKFRGLKMSFRSKIILVSISCILALYGLAGGLLTNAQQTLNDSGAQARIFESVLQHIQNDYVDEPNMEKVRGGALRGLAYGLDPYSSYLTADQVKDFQSKKSSNLVGIGAELSQVSSYLYVIAPIKGSPSDAAGIKAGDVIEYIENKATRDISLYDARQMLMGEAGTKVKVKVLRAATKPQVIEITRGAYKIPEAEVRIEAGKIGVLKIFSLEAGESADIRARLQEMTKQGVQKVIVDLRGVSAGSLAEAVSVANLFIKDGTLAQVVGRENKVLKTLDADASKFLYEGKLVVLIDQGTAGAGEVIASAILEKQRGDVVGERTFGAGTEQELFTLRGGDGLLLTTSKWASSLGKTFLSDERLASGVKPSVEVKRAEEVASPEDLVDQNENQQPETSPTPKAETPKAEDLILKKALELLQDKAMTKAAGE